MSSRGGAGDDYAEAFCTYHAIAAVHLRRFKPLEALTASLKADHEAAGVWEWAAPSEVLRRTVGPATAAVLRLRPSQALRAMSDTAARFTSPVALSMYHDKVHERKALAARFYRCRPRLSALVPQAVIPRIVADDAVRPFIPHVGTLGPCEASEGRSVWDAGNRQWHLSAKKSLRAHPRSRALESTHATSNRAAMTPTVPLSPADGIRALLATVALNSARLPLSVSGRASLSWAAACMRCDMAALLQCRSLRARLRVLRLKEPREAAAVQNCVLDMVRPVLRRSAPAKPPYLLEVRHGRQTQAPPRPLSLAECVEAVRGTAECECSGEWGLRDLLTLAVTGGVVDSAAPALPAVVEVRLPWTIHRVDAAAFFGVTPGGTTPLRPCIVAAETLQSLDLYGCHGLNGAPVQQLVTAMPVLRSLRTSMRLSSTFAEDLARHCPLLERVALLSKRPCGSVPWDPLPGTSALAGLCSLKHLTCASIPWSDPITTLSLKADKLLSRLPPLEQQALLSAMAAKRRGQPYNVSEAHRRLFQEAGIAGVLSLDALVMNCRLQGGSRRWFYARY